MQYQIKRLGTIIASVKPTGKQSKKLMGENIVPMSFSLPYNIEFEKGDYCDIFGERYALKDLNDLKKSSSIEYDYTLNLKGKTYDLQDALYLFPDSNNEYTLAGQSLMGDLNTFVDLLITNANRDQSGWVKGTIDVTDFQNITFNADENCLSVLATLATAFNTEWWVDGQTIHMTKKGVVEDITLKVGKGNGLYMLQRATSTSKNLVTRLYCYGSERNIPADYKGNSNRLKLPGSLPYLEKNVYVNDDPAQGIKYGVIEGSQVFEDVYPKRIGLVTTVGDKVTFTDSEIDFNVNTQKLGVAAKVQFQTGQLAGYTFEVSTFDNVTKSFVIQLNKDDKNYILPSDDLKPAVGDQYILLDIAMPDTYISSAEEEVFVRGTDYLESYSNPVLNYSVDCDPLDFARKNITLTLGNYIPILDEAFKLNEPIRITAFTRDLQVTHLYTMELAETVTISPIVRNAVANETLNKTVVRIGKTSNRAYNDALQAKSTADGVKLITDFWGVTIDEEHGIVASGTLLVGSGDENNAGVTGVKDVIDTTDPDHPIDKSVRFWAGAPYEDKDTAPFRVTDDGRMVSTAGKIGNFTIDDKGLSNIDGTEAYIKQIHTFPGGQTAEMHIGLQPGAGGDGNALGVFLNDKVGDSRNAAIVARASGALDHNNAIEATGDIVHVSGKIWTEGFNGLSFIQVYKGASGDNYFIEFRNGIAIRQGSGTGT